MLPVFLIVPTEKYFYGNALVSADNKEEAETLYKAKSDYNAYLFEEGNCEVKELKDLFFDENVQKVLIDNINSE